MSRLGRKLILAPYVGGLLAVALVLSQPCGLAFGQQAERWALGASEEIKDNVRQSFFIAARPVWLSRAHANYLEATARFVALKAGFDKLSAWISSLPEPVSASDWTTPAEQAERLRAELAELSERVDEFTKSNMNIVGKYMCVDRTLFDRLHIPSLTCITLFPGICTRVLTNDEVFKLSTLVCSEEADRILNEWGGIVGKDSLETNGAAGYAQRLLELTERQLRRLEWQSFLAYQSDTTKASGSDEATQAFADAINAQEIAPNCPAAAEAMVLFKKALVLAAGIPAVGAVSDEVRRKLQRDAAEFLAADARHLTLKCSER